MSNNIIKNPSADQLEAGGIIRKGTYHGLPIADWPLAEIGHTGALYVGEGHGVTITVRSMAGPSLTPPFTITEYEPPEPPPVWQTAKDDEWLTYEEDHCVFVRTAGSFRYEFVRDGKALRTSNVRRVILADPDTQTVVPKAALDRLRDCVTYGVYLEYVARDLIAAAGKASQ